MKPKTRKHFYWFYPAKDLRRSLINHREVVDFDAKTGNSGILVFTESPYRKAGFYSSEWNRRCFEPVTLAELKKRGITLSI